MKEEKNEFLSFSKIRAMMKKEKKSGDSIGTKFNFLFLSS